MFVVFGEALKILTHRAVGLINLSTYRLAPHLIHCKERCSQLNQVPLKLSNRSSQVCHGMMSGPSQYLSIFSALCTVRLQHMQRLVMSCAPRAAQDERKTCHPIKNLFSNTRATKLTIRENHAKNNEIDNNQQQLSRHHSSRSIPTWHKPLSQVPLHSEKHVNNTQRPASHWANRERTDCTPRRRHRLSPAG